MSETPKPVNHYLNSYNYQGPNYNNLPQYQLGSIPPNRSVGNYNPKIGTSGYNDKIPRYAEYGDELVSAGNLAQNRGNGQFNPPPTYDQTTNRGPAYSEALSNYESSNYYGYNNEIKNKTALKNEPVWATIQGAYDTAKKQPFVVGSSQFHIENTNQWTSDTFENNTGSKFQDWALKSTQMAPNALLMFFFSNENVLYLQKQMSLEVKRIRGVDIGLQSLDELLIIMRNKYIYAQSGWLPMSDPNKVYARGTIVNPNNKEYSKAYGSSGPTSLLNQIQKINQSVLEEGIKQILQNIDGYMQYYKDSSSLPIPMEYPVLLTMKGKELSESIGLEDGREITDALNSFNQRFNII